MSLLSLRLLGPVDVRLNNEPIDAFPADKVVALLAYLAVESDVAHPRAALSGLLWPELDTMKAQRNLRQTLYRLRTTLDSHTPGTSDQALTITRRTLQLNVQQIWLDVDALTHGLDDCLDGKKSREDCLQLTALYRGDFMSNIALKDAPNFEEWQLLQREQNHRRALALFFALCQRETANGNYDEAIRLAQKQLALEPWREEAYRQLMRALAFNDQRSEALAHYDQCAAVLQREFGVGPSEETTQLYIDIRAEKVSAIESADPSSSSSTPPISQLHHFPEYAIPFIGRDDELALISNHFTAQARRLLTIIGIGGMGKRRLATETARHIVESSEQFPDGAYYLSFPENIPVQDAVGLIASSLNPSHSVTAIDQVDAFSEVRRLRALIILDNIDSITADPSNDAPRQLHDAKDVVAHLLGPDSGLSLLVTSTCPLELTHERRLVLTGLNADPSLEPGSIQPASARMFIGIAQEFQPSWRPTADDEEAVLQICRLVDGMPLAISIAASWIRVMDCRTILTEIQNSELVLHITGENNWNRLRNIGSEYEHAWRSLPKEAQLTLAKLSVFQNGATMHAATVITDASIESLSTLVDRGFLKRHDANRGSIGPLLQRFARQKLSVLATTELVTRQRYSDYYIDMVVDSRNLLRGRVLNAEQLKRILIELDNIRQAWTWCARHSLPKAQQSLHYACLCFERSGNYNQALQMIDDALNQLDACCHSATPVASRDSACESRMLSSSLRIERSWFLWRLNRYDDAHATVQSALHTVPPKSPDSVRSLAHLVLGLVNDRLGHYAAARNAFTQALAISTTDGDRVRAGRVLNFLGAVIRILGDFDEAIRHHERSLAIARQESDRWGVSGTLHNLGLVLHDQGYLTRSRAYFDEAIHESLSIGDAWTLHVAKISLADLEIDRGDLDNSRQLLDEALAWSDASNNRWAEALSRTVKGRLLRMQGESATTEHSLSAALDIWRQLADRRGITRSIFELSLAAHAQHRFTACSELMTSALALSIELESNTLSAEILASQAALLEETGQRAIALTIASFVHTFQASSHRARSTVAHLLDPHTVTQTIDVRSATPVKTSVIDRSALLSIAEIAQQACQLPLPVNASK